MMKLPLAQITDSIKAELKRIQTSLKKEENEKEEISKELDEKIESLKELKTKLEVL